MDSKHNCIDCAGDKIVGGYVVCRIAVPIWIEQTIIKIEDSNAYMIKKDSRIVTDNCPAWYPNTPPQWTPLEWNYMSTYYKNSIVTHKGKRWACCEDHGGSLSNPVEPGTNDNFWVEPWWSVK